MKLADFLFDGRYLPPFLRDFHAQKELFKRIHENVERGPLGTASYLKGLTWVAAHVYAIDFFLHFMARHGYTLQRTRARVDGLADLDDTMREWSERQTAAFKEFLRKAAPGKEGT